MAARPRPTLSQLDAENTRLQAELAEARARAQQAGQGQALFHSHVLATLHDAVIAIDNERRVTYWGGGAERLYRLTAAEALGKPLAYSYRWDSPEDEQRALDALAAEGIWRGENDHVLPDGTVRRVESAVTVLRDAQGEATGLLALIRDMTDRRTAELGLAEANERLRQADRRKNQFLAVLSHELRNPLAPIHSGLQLLRHAPPGSEPAARAVDVVERQVRQLTRLVEDLLDVTRITEGKIRLAREALDLVGLVRRCAEDHQAIFREAGVALQVALPDDPVFVNGDAARLTQVVGNLLRNAAKFTPRGGSTQLRVEPARDHVVVRVRDTGEGISAELLGRLFEPFVQADETLDRSRGGLGLGLAVLKGLTELHGGTATAHSEGRGKGSEFVVTLPIGAASGDRSSPRESRGAASGKRRILVIEDNVDVAESLKELLQILGHEAEVAGTGTRGLEMARELCPDVVLCDLGLPGIDGFDVARALRAEPALAGTTLIALSGYAQPEDVERARQAGFHRHLAKPVDFDDLAGI